MSLKDRVVQGANTLNNALRETQVLSQLLSALPNANLQLAGSAVNALGYGKQGGSFWDLAKGVLSVPGTIGIGALAGLNSGIRGIGRKRKPASRKKKMKGAYRKPGRPKGSKNKKK